MADENLKNPDQIPLSEYRAQKAKAQRKKKGLPAPVKFILATPLLIIFCFGLFFLPYMMYQIIVSAH